MGRSLNNEGLVLAQSHAHSCLRWLPEEDESCCGVIHSSHHKCLTCLTFAIGDCSKLLTVALEEHHALVHLHHMLLDRLVARTADQNQCFRCGNLGRIRRPDFVAGQKCRIGDCLKSLMARLVE